MGFLAAGLTIIVAALAIAALLRPRSRVPGLLVVSAFAAAAGLGTITSLLSPRADLAPLQPSKVAGTLRPEFASSATCRTCHPGEHASWHRTYHRTMTQPASVEAALAPFDGRTLRFEGRWYRVATDGDQLIVDMPRFGKVGDVPEDRWRKPVVMLTGSHHMQAYWLNVDDPPSAAELSGRSVFEARCARCHGAGGRGGRAAALLGAALLPEEIAPFVDGAGQPAEDHAALPAEERGDVLAYVGRIQHDGRLSQFPFVWLTEASAWVHEEMSFLQPPPMPTVVEPAGDRWGRSCDECHSVAPVYRWDDVTLRADSGAVDLGIACEACHGPGRSHVERQRSLLARYAPRDAPPDDIVQPRRLPQKEQLHVCGQCHAETEAKGKYRYLPGADLEDSAYIVQHPGDGPMPGWMEEAIDDDPDRLTGSFWPDGTGRVAGRDLNGILLTKCTTDGPMTCLSCHTMHAGGPDAQLAPGKEGDGACTQCHQSVVATPASLEAHTRHPAGSEGSRCLGCHMPHTTFGLLQAIRAHRVDSPDPVRAATTGRPDACTLCHLDRSLGWAEAHLASWQDRPERPLPTLEASVPMGVLHLTRGDAVQRAVAAWHFRYPPAQTASGVGWAAPFLAPLLDDSYAAVRYLAGRALLAQPGYEQLVVDFTADEGTRRAAVKDAEAIWAARPLAEKLAASRVIGAEPEEVAAAIALLESGRQDPDVRINE